MSLDETRLPMPSRLAARWASRRTLSCRQVPSTEELVARKRSGDQRISVAIPAMNEAETIGLICRLIERDLIRRVPLVDELVVIDGGSNDDTASHALACGACVVDAAELLPEVPPCSGKGDAIWRGMSVLSGDIVVSVPGDIRNFDSHFVTGLVTPLLMDPGVSFVKGFYTRPIEIAGVMHPAGGGRVTELLARPLLNLLFPELGGFRQPLAGEFAARRHALRSIPLFTGDSFEAAMLIDMFEAVGLDGMAQIDLGRRVHRNRPIDELGPRAFAIARTILIRAQERKRIKVAPNVRIHPLLSTDVDGQADAGRAAEVERPPLEHAPSYLEALRA